MAAPNIPAHTPRIKYNVPMSLWFVEYSQRILKYENYRCKEEKRCRH